MDYKKQFIDEINKITNSKLRKSAKKMTKDLPEYFWHVAASSSGKYHPSISLGEGGLLRHTLMVCKCAMDLIETEMFIRDTSANRDIARVAALFHDCLKHGKVNENGSYCEHTIFEHPLCAADFVREHLEADKIDDLTVTMICDALRTHMGKWCTSKYSKVTMSKPRTDFEKMIHIADYMASRKYIKGLEEWSENKENQSEN